jgi:hypothetical protein
LRPILAREGVKRDIEGTHVPNLAAIDAASGRHPAGDYQLIELGWRDADVHGRLVAG